MGVSMTSRRQERVVNRAVGPEARVIRDGLKREVDGDVLARREAPATVPRSEPSCLFTPTDEFFR
jgi:hypothetical protein